MAHTTSTGDSGQAALTAPYKKPRTHRRARIRLGPIRVDLFVTGRPWWLPLDRR